MWARSWLLAIPGMVGLLSDCPGWVGLGRLGKACWFQKTIAIKRDESVVLHNSRLLQIWLDPRLPMG